MRWKFLLMVRALRNEDEFLKGKRAQKKNIKRNKTKYILTFSTWFKEQIYGLLFDDISWDLFCNFCIVDVLIIMLQHEEIWGQAKINENSLTEEDSEQKPNSFPWTFNFIRYDRKYKHNSSKQTHLAFFFFFNKFKLKDIK